MLVLRVAILMLAALLPISSASQAVAQSSDLIRIGAGPDDPSTPLIYASQAGLFKKAGLNVELLKLAGAAVVGAALAGGSLEIGKASTASVVTAFARGLPFTVIGAIAGYDPTHRDVALVVPANSPIKTAKDMVGQTMAAVSLQDQGSIATFAWLDQRGVDWHTLKFVEISAAASLAAMDEKRINAASLYEPVLSADVATGRVRIIGYPFDGVATRFTEAVLFGNTAWVGTHRELVDRFLKVMAEASAYVSAHEAEVLPIAAAFGGADPTALAKISHPARGVALNVNDIQPIIDTLAKYKVIPAPFSAQDMICACALRR
jgi:NitT/TauT family transport system substrate-binding protein